MASAKLQYADWKRICVSKELAEESLAELRTLKRMDHAATMDDILRDVYQEYLDGFPEEKEAVKIPVT